MRHRQRWAWVGIVCLLSAASLVADTLVLRDGRRVQGQLIGIRDGAVEFEVERGLFGRERVRVDRSDILRIEFDEDRRPNGNAFGNSDTGGNNSGPGPDRPSGMRERDITVSATDAWSNTGLTVRAGQALYFNAEGRVRWGPGRQDGPAGERNSPRNDSRPIPSRPGAALIGRVGEGDEYFFIGDDQGAIRVRASGLLYLGVNDDMLQDNSGAFRVTVYY